MKTIYKIAKTELQTLFYSPIAWLILIIFTFQCSMTFSNLMGGMVRSESLGYGNYNATLGLYSGMRGLFTAVQSYLYLYIPLLTMSLMVLVPFWRATAVEMVKLLKEELMNSYWN